MWSSSVCLKLMLLLPKELWTWGNLHRYSDQIKTTTVFLLLCDKYCVWSCVLTYSGCWTEMLLPQLLYMKGHTWTNPYLSPRVCVHASCIELEAYFYFIFFRSLARLFRWRWLHDFSLFFCLEMEPSSLHCYRTSETFQYFCVCLEKEIRTKTLRVWTNPCT